MILLDRYSGVSYTFVKSEADKDPINYIEHKYKLVHLPTKKEMDRVVYCSGQRDFLALLDSWNRQGEYNWKYWRDF